MSKLTRLFGSWVHLPGVLILFIAAHFGHHVLAALLTPLLPFIRDEFNLDYTQAGILTSAFWFIYGVSHLPAGWLGDRIGRQIMAAIGISGLAFFGILVGLSTNYIMLLIFLALMGIAGGGYHPAAAPLISAATEPKSRGTALGLHQGGGNVSFFLGPLIAVGLASFLGWRGSFISTAVVFLFFGIVFYLLLRRISPAEKTENEHSPVITGTTGLSAPKLHLIAFILLGITNQAVIISVSNFVSLFAVDYHGVSKEIGGTMLSWYFFAGIWSPVLGGYLSDRIGKIPTLLIPCLLAGPFIYLTSLVSYGWTFWLMLVALGMVQNMIMPVTESYVITHAPEQRRSLFLGVYYFGSRGGSGIITPFLGFLIDSFGFYIAFSAMSGLMLTITLICTAMLLFNIRR